MKPTQQDASELDTCVAVVGAIPDPEIPVVTLADLGILRGVCQRDDGTIEVRITPTYSGCPAMVLIQSLIEETLEQSGIAGFEVVTVMSPAWTTDWITEAGRSKMKAYGIAPPAARKPPAVTLVPQSALAGSSLPSPGTIDLTQTLFSNAVVACPRCDSESTRRISAFGSTACQEQWCCLDCHEPFDHFKCH